MPDLQALDDAALSALVYAHSKQQKTDPRREDFTLRLAYFTQELRRTGVTKLLLWQEYKKRYGEGYKYSKFCELLAEHGLIQDATMHFAYQPVSPEARWRRRMESRDWRLPAKEP